MAQHKLDGMKVAILATDGFEQSELLGLRSVAAGRRYDREVVVDGKLVTSRKPDDIHAFNRATIELFAHNRALA